MRYHHAQPAFGRDSRAGPVHRATRSKLVEWCGQVRSVPFKKAPKALVTYLEKPEMDALLATPT